MLRYAEKVYNTTVFEESVQGECIAHHLAALSDPRRFVHDTGLEFPYKPSRYLAEFVVDALERACGVNDVETALTARYSKYGRCSRGDVCLIRADDGGLEAGTIIANVAANGVPIAIVQMWVLDHNDARGFATWTDTKKADLIPLESILDVMTWRHDGGGVYTTLMGCRFRP